MSSRETFLSRVRQAVREGNTAGASVPLPDRGEIGYQGGGADRLATFVERCRSMHMHPCVVTSREAAVAKIGEILDAKIARKILVGEGPAMAALRLSDWLDSTGRVEVGARRASKQELFAADAAVTGVSSLIAETGSLVVAVGEELTRLESLLPPLHIAIATPDQIEPDLFDICDRYSATNLPPSNLVLITGPSKTGDIELKLVTGVHGPGEVHVLILNFEI